MRASSERGTVQHLGTSAAALGYGASACVRARFVSRRIPSTRTEPWNYTLLLGSYPLLLHPGTTPQYYTQVLHPSATP